MKAFDLYFTHFFGDRVFSVASQAIDAGSHEKMRIQFVRCTKELVDVAFPIANVDTSAGLTQ